MYTKANKWTKEELDYLCENYNFLTIDKILRKLNRHTRNGIYNMARKLSISNKQINRKDYYSIKYKGMSISQQAKAMGRSYSAVYRELVINRNN